MENSPVISTIRTTVENAEKPVTITEGYVFDYKKTLNKIQLYLASKFLKGTWDSEGFKKLFINIIKFRVKSSAKSVDIDVKNLKVTSEEGESQYPAYFFGKELRKFMKENGFSKLFNDIAKKAPRFGSVVVKDVKGVPTLVPLKNLRWDQTYSDIKKAPAIAEYHAYTFDEFRLAGEENGWESDKVEQVIKLYTENKATEIQVVEFYGYLKYSDIEDKKGEDDPYVKARCIVAGLDFCEDEVDATKRKFKGEPVIIEKAEIPKFPYRKWDWEEEEGRGLGVGVVEDLFIDQEYYNDTVHLERKSMHWSSKKVFTSKDEAAPSNLFTQVSNGDVLGIRDLTPVAMEERNQAQYNIVLQRITGNADDQAASYDVQTGKSLPSGTPFRLGAILSGSVDSLFEFQRESLSEFLIELIKDFVIPQFKRDKRAEHSFCFDGTGEELEAAREKLVNAHMWAEVQRFKEEKGRLPTMQEYERERAKVESEIAKGKGVYITLPEGFYDDIDKYVTFEFTAESINYAEELETLGNILTIVSKNPAMLDDPRLRAMLNRIADRAGQNPIGLFSSYVKTNMPGLLPGATTPASTTEAVPANPLASKEPVPAI